MGVIFNPGDIDFVMDVSLRSEHITRNERVTLRGKIHVPTWNVTPGSSASLPTKTAREIPCRLWFHGVFEKA